MKFKVGDRIKVIGVDGYLDIYRGKPGVISSSCDDKLWVWNIKMLEGDTDEFCVSEKEIELTIQPNQQLLFDFMKD